MKHDEWPVLLHAFLSVAELLALEERFGDVAAIARQTEQNLRNAGLPQNKARAMAMLKSRLAERARLERLEHLAAIRGEQGEAAWGRQVRSYVLQPYQMVKDLRTDYEVGNVLGVLDGDLRGFVEAYLRWRRSEYEAGDNSS